MRAVSLRAMNIRGRIRGPLHVFTMSHGLQVCGIHTARIPTQVIQLHALGNISDEQPIRAAMCPFPSAAMRKLPVSILLQKPVPYPTPTAVRSDHLREKPFNLSSHVRQLSSNLLFVKHPVPTLTRIPGRLGRLVFSGPLDSLAAGPNCIKSFYVRHFVVAPFSVHVRMLCPQPRHPWHCLGFAFGFFARNAVLARARAASRCRLQWEAFTAGRGQRVQRPSALCLS